MTGVWSCHSAAVMVAPTSPRALKQTRQNPTGDVFHSLWSLKTIPNSLKTFGARTFSLFTPGLQNFQTPRPKCLKQSDKHHWSTWWSWAVILPLVCSRVNTSLTPSQSSVIVAIYLQLQRESSHLSCESSHSFHGAFVTFKHLLFSSHTHNFREHPSHDRSAISPLSLFPSLSPQLVGAFVFSNSHLFGPLSPFKTRTCL